MISIELWGAEVNTIAEGILIGLMATFCLDVLTAVAMRPLRLPTTDWALIGRWFGHLSRGKVFHEAIAESPAVPNELVIGWVAHYCTGMVYGVAYLSIVQELSSIGPSLWTAVAFGLATLVAPWMILAPGMGAGLFGRKAARPSLMWLVSATMHVVFGASLYLSWVLLN